jgi:hypothetical protein
MKNFIFFIVFLFCLSGKYFATEIDVAKSLAIIESVEKQIQNIRWEFVLVDSKNNELTRKITVLYEYHTGYYFTSDEGFLSRSSKDNNGDISNETKQIEKQNEIHSDIIGKVSRSAYNGDRYVSWSCYNKNQSQLPKDGESGEGCISMNSEDCQSSKMSQRLRFIGTAVGTPLLFHFGYNSPLECNLLSHFIKKWIKDNSLRKVEIDDNGILCLTAQYNDLMLWLRYDPSRLGGNIIEYKYSKFLTAEEKEIEVVLEHSLILYKKLPSGLYMPISLIKEYPFEYSVRKKYAEKMGISIDDKENMRQEFPCVAFTSYEINVPTTPKDFILSIPVGITVVDHIKKQLYTVGEMIDDKESLARFMVLNHLEPPDKDFFRKSEPFFIVKNSLRIVMFIVGLICLVIAIYWGYKKRL